MSNLTPAQQSTLESAAGRANGSIYPLPGNIKGGATKKVIKALHQQGLIEEIETDVWRITKAGYAAIGMQHPPEMEEESDKVPATADEPPAHGPGPDFSDDAVAQAWNDNMPAEDAAYHAEMNAASEEPDGPDDYDEPPRSIIVPMDPADLPQANADEAPADADFEEDVTAAEQAMAETENPNILLDADEDYLRIARKHLPEELVTPINWPWIRNALTDAYMLGHEEAKQKKTRQTPEPATPRRTRENSKQAQVIAMLKRPEGATIEQISDLTNWSSNTVRGFLAGALKKKLGLNVVRMPHTAGTPSRYRIES